MEIIDSHVHAYPEKIVLKAKENLERAYSRKIIDLPVLDTLFKRMDESGISKSVLAAVASRPDQVVPINNWLFSIKDKRVIPFAALHPFFEGYKEEIKRIKDNACGVKLQSEFQNFYADGEKVFPVYEELQKYGIAVLFHCGVELSSAGGEAKTSPARVAKVLEKFPQLKVIGAHMGGFLMWEESLEKLAGKNICIDTSESIRIMPRDLLLKFFEKHGFDKIFFGSDFPIGSQKQDIDFINALDISEENKVKILGQNIKKFLNL